MHIHKETNSFLHPNLDLMLKEGYYFDPKYPNFTNKFITNFIKVPSTGKPFKPYSWHEHYFNSLLGWRQPGGFPAYNNSFCYVAKKNGKSAVVAILAMVYSYIYRFSSIACLATAKDQTKNIMDQIKAFIKSDSTLKKSFKIRQWEIINLETESVIMGKSGDGKSQDGGNARIVLFDEYVHWRDQKSIELNHFYEGAIKGCGLDYQLIKISTAYTPDPRSLGLAEYNYSKKMLNGELKKPNLNYLPVIFEAPQGKTPMEYLKNKEWWYEANPTMRDEHGHIKEATFERDMEQEFQKGPLARDTFLTLYLNVWRDMSEQKIISDDEWMSPKACEEPIIDVNSDKPIMIGVDPASVRDCTAITICQFDHDGVLNIKSFAYQNEERARELFTTMNVPFDEWREWGVLTLFKGNAQDVEQIKNDLLQFGMEYNAPSFAFDKAKSFGLMQHLSDAGYDVWEVPQTPAKLTPAVLELQRLASIGMIRHGGNPFLRYCIYNTYMKKTNAGLFLPFKKKEWQFIDGTASLLTSLAVLIGREEIKLDANTMFF